jgi:phosphatidylserine/phosphatidylglycerophosphate/cardiolipin synthase-like enzyme
MLHAKSIVIDDEIAIIGNFNIDPRSEFLNTELAVAAHDAAVARELRLSMDAHLANAWLIGRDGMAEGESRRFPNVSTGKIIKLRFFQMIAPLVKKQL